MIGSRLAQYQILERIGRGGMGEVYRARDTKLDRDVALKILPEDIAHDTERSRRFENEAKAVAALSHPNILAIYDFGSEGGRYYAAMELLEGETLADRLAQGPIPPRKAAELAAQMADGVAAAHERGVIHRDLKPANVIITSDGRAKILDFGLARLEEMDSTLTQSPTVRVQTGPGTMMGTVGYMSPEQVRGEAVDARTDIFSLGVVVYEMLTGVRAFEGSSSADVIGAILRDEPPPLRARDPSLPQGLERIVQRCLEKRPEERFQSARDLCFALSNADPPSQSQPSGDAPSRARGRRVAALAVLAAAGWLLAAIMLVQQFLGPAAKPPVRLRTLSYSGRDWAPSASPQGDMIAFVSDRDGVARIWLKQMAGGGEAPITEGSDDNPRFSPDGSQVLFVRNEHSARALYRTSVVGGQTRKLLDNVMEADWSPDGARVAFLRTTPVGGDNIVAVGVADVRTASERVVAQIENRSCYGIRWSPDGARIAVNEASLTGNVVENSYVDLIDVETGAVERLAPTDWSGPFTAVEWAPSGRSLVVGQAADALAHVTGTPSQIMTYDLEAESAVPLFWLPVRLPRGGWGSSTLAVVNDDQIVIDDQVVRAELQETAITAADGGQSPRVLTGGVGLDRQPAYSPDGAQVIFSSNRSGNIDLWTVDRKSGAMRQLTDDSADDWDPAFTPDGEHLLWSSDRGGNMEVWMADRDGSQARQVTRDGVDAENPTMTADGKWIVYASSHDDKRGIWKVRPDGSDATALAVGSYLLPEVSPDGRYALFTRIRNLNFGLQVVDVATAEMVPFEIEVAAAERRQNVVFGRARWMPDGGAIVYVGQDEQGRSGVYAQDFAPGHDTSGSRRKLAGFSPVFTTESLGVSPDGTTVIISAGFDRRTLRLADYVPLRGW